MIYPIVVGTLASTTEDSALCKRTIEAALAEEILI